MGLKIYFILKFNMFVSKKILLFSKKINKFFIIVGPSIKFLRASPLEAYALTKRCFPWKSNLVFRGYVLVRSSLPLEPNQLD